MEAAAATVVRREELAARTRTGDRQAFVRLYEPDLGRVYDLVLRTLRDSELAAIALREALGKAWDIFLVIGAPFDVTTWLYGLAREAALDCPPKRKSTVGAREGLDYTRVDPTRLSDPFMAFDRNLMEVVWDAVIALDRDDYSLLDLHVRRDLNVTEIAEQLGLSTEHLTRRLSQLCDSLNDDVGATLLATRARHACATLDAALPGTDVRRTVRRHVLECMPCRETKGSFVPATEILGSLGSMTPPPSLREQLARVFLAAGNRRD